MTLLNSAIIALAMLVEKYPGNTHYQRELSISYYNLGDVEEAQGNWTTALEYYKDSLKIAQKLVVRDRIPVSQNEKIVVEIRNPSLQPAPEEGKEDTEFQQGQRKYTLELKPGEKRAINYELVVTYDKEAGIQGLN